MGEDATRTYDPAVLVRDARIAERYQPSEHGLLVDDEAMRCVVCGFASRLDGTPFAVWVRIRKDHEPIIVELCQICHAAAAR